MARDANAVHGPLHGFCKFSLIFLAVLAELHTKVHFIIRSERELGISGDAAFHPQLGKVCTDDKTQSL